MKNFLLTTEEPKIKGEYFSKIVRAESCAKAKKYFRFLHALYRDGKPLKISSLPTNEQYDYITVH